MMWWWSLALAGVDLVVLDPEGEPVADARVQASQPTAPTDRRGRTTLELPDGTHLVTVLAPGYRPVDLQVELPRRRPVRLQLLAADADLQIVVEALRSTPHSSRHVVDAEQATETPGTLDDAVRLVSALPGVTVQREYSPTSGDLSVRGSAPGDSRYLLDGVEIPYLYHFNQYASVFPTSQIGTLQLLPSTFGPSFGDAVGAVVDARSRLEVPKAAHGGAHLNFVMVGGDVKVPLNDDGLWVSASGRRSYQDLAGEQTTQYPVWPVFHDFVLRLEQGDAEQGTGAFVMGAGDGYQRAVAELDVADPLEAETSPVLSYDESFEVAGLHHRFAADRVAGRFVGAVVGHRRHNELSDRGDSHYAATTAVLRGDVHSVGEGVGWEAGVEVRSGQASLAVSPAGPEGLRVAEEAPVLSTGVAVDDDIVWHRLGAYGGLRVRHGRLQLMPGLRVEGASEGLPRVEPRGALRYELSDATTLKLAGGRYTQGLRPEERLAVPTLPVIDSWQVAGGVEQTLGGRVELGLDAYAKDLRDARWSVPGQPVRAVPVGEAIGAELYGRYRLRERLFVWGWLSVQRTRLGVDGAWVPADGDQRLAGGGVVSYDVGRTNLGARYRLASGLPFTGAAGSLYDAGSDRWVPVLASPNAERLPTYHKLDLRIAYTWTLPGWTLTASAEVWLVPRSSAQLYPTWSYDYREQGWVTGPTVLPLLGLRARF
jgi:hypothetical protein